MNKTPVIDALFRAIVAGDESDWTHIETSRSAECVDVRAIISNDNPGGVDLDLQLGISSNEYVIPVFEGPRANFISRQTSLHAQIANGRSGVLLDYSLSFDSNFAEKLRALINGQGIQDADKNRVLDVLKLKANNDRVQFDVVLFLFENLRLAREDQSNERPLNTLIAFRMLDYLNWEAFRENPNNLDFGLDVKLLQKKLRPECLNDLSKLYNDAEVVNHEAKCLGTQALLVRFASLWHEPKRDIKRIFTELLDYCIFEFGYMPSTELSLIWTGISQKNVAPFFGPIVGRAKDMLQEIRGMAWDMTHLRVMEQAARKSESGSFFIPYFVSLDARWRELLRLNPIRFMLMDDAHKQMLSGRKNEVSFQTAFNECLSEKASRELTPEKVAARRSSAMFLGVEAMRQRVAIEELRWLSRQSA